jgi:acetyl-CoA carboxylase biotin carboxyl carrier protein
LKDTDFTIAEIKELIKTFRESGLSVMKVQHGGFSLELEKAGAPAIAAPPVANVPQAPAEAPVQAVAGNVVKSPIVGTFYAAPAPDKPPFVSVGSSVKKGDVLFIIESMKLMNEVTSEFDGTVREIFAQNGGVVEYGQAVMVIHNS